MSHMVIEEMDYTVSSINFFSIGFARYALDLNLTDEQLCHPLMREAEGVISGAWAYHAISVMCLDCKA